MRIVCGRPIEGHPGATCMQRVKAEGLVCAAHKAPNLRPSLRRVEAMENLRAEVRRMNQNVQKLLRQVENMRA